MLVYRILSSLLYPPDLARIVQSYSYSDDYAIANAKFPSLIARRDYCLYSMFGWATVDNDHSKSLSLIHCSRAPTLGVENRLNGRTVRRSPKALTKPFDHMTDDRSTEFQHKIDARNTVAVVPLECLNYIASLVSEYSLLPPFSKFDCFEESELTSTSEYNLESRSVSSNPVIEDRFVEDPDTSIDHVHYEWSRYDNVRGHVSNACNLRFFVSLHHECLKHYNYRHDWCERCSVDEYSVTELDQLDPSDVVDYDSYEEEDKSYVLDCLGQASMSFYYREFLNGHCQCSWNGCLGK